MLHPTASSSVEERLERLERRQRVTQALALLLAALVVVAGTRPSATSDALRTQRLEVVDASGTVRAHLIGTPDGATLDFVDGNGVSRLSLQHGTDDTALYVRDASGTTRIGVAQFAHGGGGIALHGEEARGAAVLYLKRAAGSLTFYGTDGDVLLRFPADDTATVPGKATK